MNPPRFLAIVAVVGLAVFGMARAKAEDGWLDGFNVDPSWAPASPMERPADHDALWLTSHGAAAATGDCLSCHVEDTCASCHAGENVPAAAHPAGYLFLHAGDATSDAASCASCHTTTRFCQGCHTSADLTATAADRPAPWAQVHGPDWLDPMATGNHAHEARADIMSCASCHSGEECATCHIDVNPHGSAFIDRCAPMLDAAERTCASCHTLRSPMPMDVVRQHPSCAR